MPKLFSYNLFLSHKRRNRQNLEPIYCRIKIGKLLPERSTGCFVNPTYFNPDFKRVSNKAPDAEYINSRLNAFETLLDNLAEYTNDLDVINSSIDKLLWPHKRAPASKQIDILFADAMEQFMKLQRESIKRNEEDPLEEGITQGTYNTYVTRQKNIVAFLQQNNYLSLRPHEFTRYKAKEFKNWWPHSPGHLTKHLVMIKSIIIWANAEHGTPLNDFITVKIRKPKPKKIFLTEREIALMVSARFASKTLEHVRDIFIFQCFTGLAYNDLMRFKKEMIQNHAGRYYISYTRKKTAVNGLLPLFDMARIILLKYNYELPRMTNQCYNRLLKEIAAICGIEKHLTTHVGRKTFGTYVLNNGASIESTTKMLAKTSIAETSSTYAEVLHKRLINEMPFIQTQIGLF